MKLMAGLLGVLLLIGPASLRGEEYSPPEEYAHDQESLEAGPVGTRRLESDHPERSRGSRERHGDSRFKQFRREVHDLGKEVRGNFQLIEALEEELGSLAPGTAADETRRRLAELKRRQAELRLDLARKKVDFALRARQFAEERYRKAFENLERVMEIVAGEYPDLAAPTPVE